MPGSVKKPALRDARASDEDKASSERLADREAPLVRRGRWGPLPTDRISPGPVGTYDALDVSADLLATASFLFVLGGLDPAPKAVPWYRFVGLGVLVLGGLFVVYWIEPLVNGGRTTADLAFALVGVVSAFVFGFMGVDWFRGGCHYDLSRFDSGPILGDDGHEQP